MKDKLRSKSFWMSLIGALLVFLQTLGFTLDLPAVSEAVSAGLALLVVMGIISGDDGKGSKRGESGESETDNGESEVGETKDGEAGAGAQEKDPSDGAAK